MLKVSHTVQPPCRMSNTVKPGGLYYKDQQDDLVKEARRLVQPPSKVKNQFVTFAGWFWALTAIGSVITFFILNATKA